MKKSKKNVKFSVEEVKEIFRLRQMGYKYSEIATAIGRSYSGIAMFFKREKEAHTYSAMLGEQIPSVRETPATPQKEGEAPVNTHAELTPREMIKRLYDLGYRIEDNNLVCYQRVQVKIQDIINS